MDGASLYSRAKLFDFKVQVLNQMQLNCSNIFKCFIKGCFITKGEKGIVADAGIVADNDISRTIIIIKK